MNQSHLTNFKGVQKLEFYAPNWRGHQRVIEYVYRAALIGERNKPTWAGRGVNTGSQCLSLHSHCSTVFNCPKMTSDYEKISFLQKCAIYLPISSRVWPMLVPNQLSQGFSCWLSVMARLSIFNVRIDLEQIYKKCGHVIVYLWV